MGMSMSFGDARLAGWWRALCEDEVAPGLVVRVKSYDEVAYHGGLDAIRWGMMQGVDFRVLDVNPHADQVLVSVTGARQAARLARRGVQSAVFVFPVSALLVATERQA